MAGEGTPLAKAVILLVSVCVPAGNQNSTQKCVTGENSAKQLLEVQARLGEPTGALRSTGVAGGQLGLTCLLDICVDISVRHLDTQVSKSRGQVWNKDGKFFSS